MKLTAILKQRAKSDKEVIKEALSEGYTGSEIRKALIKVYPLSYRTTKEAYNFYNTVASSIEIEFFKSL